MSRRFGLIYCAWLISLAGVLMSFFWERALQVPPCALCWYQRMALFPLALLLAIGAYRDERALLGYGMALAAMGAVLALYQRYSPLCGAHCANADALLFGVVPFSLISALGFSLIFALLWLGTRRI